MNDRAGSRLPSPVVPAHQPALFWPRGYRQEMTPKDFEQHLRKSRPPVTYFVYSKGMSAVKIGKSVNVSGRLKGILNACPDAKLIGCITGDYELYFHRKFRHLRITSTAREWFRFTAGLRDFCRTEFKFSRNFGSAQLAGIKMLALKRRACSLWKIDQIQIDAMIREGILPDYGSAIVDGFETLDSAFAKWESVNPNASR